MLSAVACFLAFKLMKLHCYSKPSVLIRLWPVLELRLGNISHKWACYFAKA